MKKALGYVSDYQLESYIHIRLIEVDIRNQTENYLELGYYGVEARPPGGG